MMAPESFAIPGTLADDLAAVFGGIRRVLRSMNRRDLRRLSRKGLRQNPTWQYELGIPNGAQLQQWREQERKAVAQRRILSAERNARRPGPSWWSGLRWPRWQRSHLPKKARAALCREAGVPNTGRQWRKLVKRLRRVEVSP